MKVHPLKTWSEFFTALESGAKTFEARRNDRNFQVGDVLWLREYRPFGKEGAEEYTGRSLHFDVTYILKGPAFGIEDGYCVMALRKIEAATENDRSAEEMDVPPD